MMTRGLTLLYNIASRNVNYLQMEAWGEDFTVVGTMMCCTLAQHNYSNESIKQTSPRILS